jgi:hypothetical protein
VTNAHPLARAAGLLVHAFGQKVTWTRQSNGTWKSSGGRVLSDASYQRIKQKAAQGKKAPARKPAAKKSAAKSAPPQKPGAKTAGKGGTTVVRPAAAAEAPKPEETLPTGTVKNAYGQPIPASAGALPGEPGYKPSPRPPADGTVKRLSNGVPVRMKTGVAAPPAAPRPTNPGTPPPGSKAGPAPLDAATKAQAVEILTRKPPAAPKLPGDLPPPPPPSPAEMAYVNAQAKKDESRFGKRAAEFLRGALSYAVGMLTAGNGAAYGALAGLAVGGPLGLAVGTALGGGIGARLGTRAAYKTYQTLGGRGRAAVQVRKAARAVVPKAAAAAVGVPMALGGMAMTAGATQAGATLAGVPGAILGGALGSAAGIQAAGNAGELAQGAAKGTRLTLARSKAARRKARQTNRRKLFAEVFADGAAPSNLDPVVLLRARIKAMFARRGLQIGDVPDQTVLAALAMAGLAEEQGLNQDPGAAAPTAPAPDQQAFAEGVGLLSRIARRIAP